MTTGKTITLTRWTFVAKVMSLLFNLLSRLVITKVTPIKNKFKNRWWFPISLSSSVTTQKDRGSSLALGGENHGFSSGAWEWQILLSQQQKAIALKGFATSEEVDETLYSSPGSHQPPPLLLHQQELELSSLLPCPQFFSQAPIGDAWEEVCECVWLCLVSGNSS